jgi:hypothetical protein
MSRYRVGVVVGAVLALFVSCPASRAQSFAPVGNLDCNGYSQIQNPLRPQHSCADFLGEYGEPGTDNGHYIGHDEPSIGFISTASHSGNNVQEIHPAARAPAAGDAIFRELSRFLVLYGALRSQLISFWSVHPE